MTAAREAAVDRMWRRVLREKGLPTDEAAVAEADCMWREILKEKGLPLDQVYERLDKDTVPLEVLTRSETQDLEYQQRKQLGNDGFKEMMKKKVESYGKFIMAKQEMNKMMLKKAGKEEEMKKIGEDQEGVELIPCSNKKKKHNKEKKKKNKEKKKNKRKRHGDDDDDNHNKKKMMKKATTSF